MRHFYAWVEIREWGEPDRGQRIGPFTPEDPDATVEEQIETLRQNLEQRGDVVQRIWLASPGPRDLETRDVKGAAYLAWEAEAP